METWWRKLFIIGKFEIPNRKFASEIVTDGKAVNTEMHKPKQNSVLANSRQETTTLCGGSALVGGIYSWP